VLLFGGRFFGVHACSNFSVCSVFLMWVTDLMCIGGGGSVFGSLLVVISEDL
jgi:hypothetical protein